MTVDNTGPTIGRADRDGNARRQRLVHEQRRRVTWPAPTDAVGHRHRRPAAARRTSRRTRPGQLAHLLGDGQRRQHRVQRRSTIKRDANAADRDPDRAGQRRLRSPASVTVSSDSADGGSGVANATFQYSPAGAGTWTTIGAPDTTTPVQRDLEHRVRSPTAATTCGSITTDNAGLTFTSATRTVVRRPHGADGDDHVPGGRRGLQRHRMGRRLCDQQRLRYRDRRAPGTVTSVTVTIRRSSDNRYWNGNTGNTHDAVVVDKPDQRWP